MAHRAAGFAKKPPVAAPHVRATAQAAFVPNAPQRPIPLALGPVIAPYKKHGRLSLRIERMPQLARLSRGRNNGNGSWSLGLDELEDLAFLPPDGMDGGHKLAIRIIGLDGGNGETLALIDFPVSPGESASVSAADSDALKQLQRLHGELAEMKRALDEREAELQQARQETADTEIEKARLDVEKALTDARGAWRRETDDELAVTLDNAERKIASARETERRAARDALSKAEAEWRAAEAVRLTEAETRWQAQARAADADTKRHDETLLSLRDELASAHAAMAQQKEAAALANSEADDARRLARVETEELKQQIARATSRYETAQAELTAQQSAPVKADPEQAQQIEALRQLLASMTMRYDAAKASLTELQNKPLQADPAIAQRVEDLTRQLADMTARCETAEAHSAAPVVLTDPEQQQRIDTLTQQLAAMTARCNVAEALAARPAPPVVDVPDVEAILLKARQTWTSEEAGRLAAARSTWQNENANVLRETALRCETAEATLAMLRAEMEHSGEDAVHLQAEIAQLQETLAERDNELVYARATLGMRSGLAADLAVESAARPRIDPNAEERARTNRKLVRDIGLAASFAFVVILAVVIGLPRLIPLLPYDTQVAVIGLGQDIGLYSAPANVREAAAHAKPAAIPPNMAMLTHGANVRSMPSTKSTVVASLTRGTAVVPLEMKGSWTRVRLGDASEGWVFSAYLRTGKPKP